MTVAELIELLNRCPQGNEVKFKNIYGEFPILKARIDDSNQVVNLAEF